MNRLILCAALALAAVAPLEAQVAEATVVSPEILLVPLDIDPRSGLSGLTVEGERHPRAFGVSYGQALTSWFGVVLQAAAGEGRQLASADVEIPFHGNGALLAGVQIDQSDIAGKRVGAPVAVRFAGTLIRWDRFSISPLMLLGWARRWDDAAANDAVGGRHRNTAAERSGAFAIMGARFTARPVWLQLSYGMSRQLDGDDSPEYALPPGSTMSFPARTRELTFSTQYVVRFGLITK